jgi:hypothetical protein
VGEILTNSKVNENFVVAFRRGPEFSAQCWHTARSRPPSERKKSVSRRKIERLRTGKVAIDPAPDLPRGSGAGLFSRRSVASEIALPRVHSRLRSPLRFSGPTPHYSGARAYFPDQCGPVSPLISVDIDSGARRNATEFLGILSEKFSESRQFGANARLGRGFVKAPGRLHVPP